MYPFNSKILARNVNNESPLRIFFKLNQTITTVPIGYDAANYFVLAGLEFATGEKPLCFFREYQKVTGTSLFLSGSYNSMKHSTQFLTLYTHCSFDLSNNVMI